MGNVAEAGWVEGDPFTNLQNSSAAAGVTASDRAPQRFYFAAKILIAAEILQP
jgi:hypothetical protein